MARFSYFGSEKIKRCYHYHEQKAIRVFEETSVFEETNVRYQVGFLI